MTNSDRWGMLLVTVAAGCGGPASVVSGTRGTLHSGDLVLPGVQVALYRTEGGDAELMGFGVSDSRGEFGLVQDAAAGPLWLEPGDYAITLESIGPEPLAWPAEYRQPEKTPLKYAWNAEDELLELDVPSPGSWR